MAVPEASPGAGASAGVSPRKAVDGSLGARVGAVVSVGDYAVFMVLLALLTPVWGPRGEDVWAALMTADVWHGDINLAVAVVSFVIPAAVYWAHAGCLTAVDLGLYCRHTRQSKLQPKHTVSARDTLVAVAVVVRNQLVSLVTGFVFAFYVYPWRGCTVVGPFPSAIVALRDLAVFTVMEELVFYHIHRALHHPVLYKRLHKQHHDFSAPFGWCAIYSGVVEQLGNIAAVASGPLLMGSHTVLTLCWVVFAMINTVNAHSGYEVWGMPSPRQHDWHHERFTENFGFLGVLDSWYGTNSRFLEHERARGAAAAKRA